MIIRKSQLGIAKALAVSYHKTSGIEIDELKAEANLAMLEAIRIWNPIDESSLTNWIFLCVSNRLRNFIKNEAANHFISLDENWHDRPYSPKYFFESFDAMNKESKEIVSIVLSDPNELLCVPGKIARGLIISKLITQHDWTWQKINRAFKKLKLDIKELF